jgi:NAD(P)-dependent dehydrogenase (short-subunit alcohol dehydrogenase family)
LSLIGGTTGLGLSAAKAFIAEGQKLLLSEEMQAVLQKQKKILGKSAEALAADATHPETANNSILTCIEEFGSFDGLYHVAGGSGRKFGDGPLHELTLKDGIKHWN